MYIRKIFNYRNYDLNIIVQARAIDFSNCEFIKRLICVCFSILRLEYLITFAKQLYGEVSG